MGRIQSVGGLHASWCHVEVRRFPFTALANGGSCSSQLRQRVEYKQIRTTKTRDPRSRSKLNGGRSFRKSGQWTPPAVINGN